MTRFGWKPIAAACAAALLANAPAPALAQQGKTLRVVMHSDLKILDPIWTTAYIVRNHGYMIYDTLFATDANGEIKPQMVDEYTVSPDQLTHTMRLRDGLVWHDGAPVTSEDCAASIKRWAAKDAMGQRLMNFVDSISTPDAKTIVVKLKSPTGLLLAGLGKPSSTVAFMMPKRVAETDPNTQISDFTGSGPFIFKREEWRPGDKTVYVKFDKYKPRAEAPSGLAGGKVANIDRVEWRAIPDPQQAVNALLAGEIDVIEAPSHDLLPLLKADKAITLFDWNPLGNQYSLRPNWNQKPFDNPKIREALWYALNQKDFLDASIGDPAYYKECKAYFICGAPLETTAGMEGRLTSNFAKARELLKEANYDGAPVVLLHGTDVAVAANLSPVAKSLLEKAGFKVDMQTSDWQTILARRVKKDPASAGGWNLVPASWGAADILNPVATALIGAACDKASYGWPCDETMEKLRDDYARATDPAKQKEIATAVQRRAIEITTHIPLGQWYQPGAHRPNVSGWLKAPAAVFWNMTLK